MNATVTGQVRAGHRQAHTLLRSEALAADPPYPAGQVVTAGELTLPAARGNPQPQTPGWSR